MRPLNRIGVERQTAARELLQAARFLGTPLLQLLQVRGWGSHDDCWCYTEILLVLNRSSMRRGLITWWHRWHRRGLGGLRSSLLLGPKRQLRVGSVSKPHDAEPPGHRRLLLDRRGRGALVGVASPRGSPQLSVGRAAAIMRDSNAVGAEILLGWIGAAGLVAAFEEPEGVEGATAMEVPFAAVCAEGPQRHCDGEARHLIYACSGGTGQPWHSGRGGGDVGGRTGTLGVRLAD